MRDYNFKVETIESGQRRKYGDSYYHYIIEDMSDKDYDDSVIKRFCTGFLNPVEFSKEDRNKAIKENPDNFDLNFDSYYTDFEKVDDRKFMYKVISPSTH